MCGRAYETYTDEELAMRYLNGRPVEFPKFSPNFNLAPTQQSPIVRMVNGENKIDFFRWGLVPAWAKTVKDAAKYSLINARGEEIAEKRTYKDAFLHRRCVVPFSGFFEWHRTEDGKRPYAIHLKKEPIMSVAGVWEHWLSKETGELVDSFSVVTTAANRFMEKIHDRMPVILGWKEEKEWLDPKNDDNGTLLKSLVRPCPDDWLESHEVSTLVNSPRNNSKEILEPVERAN